jgi:hypothetical protein
LKPRHAAALALVGWYLLLPQWSSPNQFDATAPISRWHQEKSFDTAGTCEQYRQGAVDHFSKDKEQYPRNVVEYNVRLYKAGLCIEADDPRLK